jgi:hypothetical protein
MGDSTLGSQRSVEASIQTGITKGYFKKGEVMKKLGLVVLIGLGGMVLGGCLYFFYLSSNNSQIKVADVGHLKATVYDAGSDKEYKIEPGTVKAVVDAVELAKSWKPLEFMPAENPALKGSVRLYLGKYPFLDIQETGVIIARADFDSLDGHAYRCDSPRLANLLLRILRPQHVTTKST